LVTIPEGIRSSSPERKRLVTSVITLAVLIGSVALLVSHPFVVQGTTVAPGSLPSWNPAVTCTALLTSIEGVIGRQSNANGGATYAGGGFIPGIPNKRSTSPPCTVNGNATFVEMHGVQMITLTYAVEDCAQYTNGNFCDTTFNVQDPKCASSDIYLCRIHTEIDQAWKSAGVAPQNPPVTSQLLDIQGFVYWDDGHTNDSWHSFSGWEIHTISAWRFSSSMTPDFGLSINPTKLSVQQGSSSTAIVTVSSIDGFKGTVTLSASVTAKIANTTSVALNPPSVSITSGGSATLTLTIQASSSASVYNFWTLILKGTSGSLTHTLLVTLAITRPPPDFNISASPTSATLKPGSSQTVTITLRSLYNFTGTVNLAASVVPADTAASLSPVEPTASTSPASVSVAGNGSASSTLSVSASLLTTPGNYTVTIKADSGTLSHSATVSITVTLL
jgi:uncharacterized membrane protein